MKNHKVFFIWNGWIGKWIKEKKAIDIEDIKKLIRLFETGEPKKDYQIFCKRK